MQRPGDQLRLHGLLELSWKPGVRGSERSWYYNDYLVGLDPHILRVETACVVVSALLLERMAALRCS